MKIVAYDTKNRKKLYSFDALFGLNNIVILSVNDPCICSVMLHEELMKRAYIKDDYETDLRILKELDLDYKSYLFGRMSEACVLYAILHNFQKENSDIIFLPEKTELISFIDIDDRYGNIYIWRSIDDLNASK